MIYLYKSLMVVHVICAVFWVGSVLFQSLFMGPAMMRLNVLSKIEFSKRLRQHKVHYAMSASALGTILAGIGAFSIVPGFGHITKTLSSLWGRFICIGAISGIAMIILAIFFIEPVLSKITNLQYTMLDQTTVKTDADVLGTTFLKLKIFTSCEMLFGIIAIIAMTLASH